MYCSLNLQHTLCQIPQCAIINSGINLVFISLIITSSKHANVLSILNILAPYPISCLPYLSSLSLSDSLKEFPKMLFPFPTSNSFLYLDLSC